MTICIAALCKIPGLDLNDPQAVIAASDRMLTAGDIQFEPPQPKVYGFGTNAIALISGQINEQIEICDLVFRGLAHSRAITIADLVEHYCRELVAYNKRQAERVVLAPLGLTLANFLSQQEKLGADMVDMILDRMTRQRADVQTIIAGLDRYGAHIFTVDASGRTACHNSTGFVSIGEGAWHANSQFMLAGHTPQATAGATLMLTYAAKKRAEVAPGVGSQTDLTIILPDRPWSSVADAAYKKVEAAYNKMDRAQRQAAKRASSEIEAFISKTLAPPQDATSSG